MNKQTEEKLEREVKQIGLDIVIFAVIAALTLGFVFGAIIY